MRSLFTITSSSKIPDHQAMACVIFMVSFLVLTNANAMSGKPPEVDPACFADDEIRVEIGEERFAFPREIIHSMNGDDVVNAYKRSYNNASGVKACQKTEDEAWKINSMILRLIPQNCVDKIDCNIKTISATIYPYNEARWQRIVPNTPHTAEQLLLKCRPPRDSVSEHMKKYWRNCSYAFRSKAMDIVMKFTGGGGIYPPEKIEKTKQLVLEEVGKYRMK